MELYVHLILNCSRGNRRNSYAENPPNCAGGIREFYCANLFVSITIYQPPYEIHLLVNTVLVLFPDRLQNKHCEIRPLRLYYKNDIIYLFCLFGQKEKRKLRKLRKKSSMQKQIKKILGIPEAKFLEELHYAKRCKIQF